MTPHGTSADSAPVDPSLWDDEDLVDADEFLRKTIAADLRAARKAAGLTQAQVAVKLGKSRSSVGAAERGVVDVGWDYARALLGACGLSENWKPFRG